MQQKEEEKIFGFARYPKFRLGEPRFPQDTFLGRYLHFVDAIDPRTLFTSKQKLAECVKLLNDYKAGKRVAATDEQLWQAQKVKSAILHPDTGEKVLPPFRMSGFVPFGWITVTGMLLPNPSWPTLLFWQWANQSHNALVNYSNRNATQNQPISKYATAYVAAVTSACSIATVLTIYIKRSTGLSPGMRMIVQRFVPLPATSLASCLNVLCMRYNEIESGVEVYDEQHKVIGVSKAAAQKAVLETAVTRAFLPIPPLLAPPIIMPFLERYPFVTKTAFRHLFVNAIVCTICFAISLPISLAMFPQESSISASKLEPEIRAKTKHATLFYNRGL